MIQVRVPSEKLFKTPLNPRPWRTPAVPFTVSVWRPLFQQFHVGHGAPLQVLRTADKLRKSQRGNTTTRKVKLP